HTHTHTHTNTHTHSHIILALFLMVPCLSVWNKIKEQSHKKVNRANSWHQNTINKDTHTAPPLLLDILPFFSSLPFPFLSLSLSLCLWVFVFLSLTPYFCLPPFLSLHTY